MLNKIKKFLPQIACKYSNDNADEASIFSNDVLRSANYYFLTLDIPENMSGLQHSILRRCQEFGSFSNIKTTVLTISYNIDREKIYRSLIANKKIDANYTRIMNMYDFYKGNVKCNTPPIERRLEEPGCAIYKKPGRNAYRFFRNGMYFMYKSFERPDGRLKFIDYLSEFRYRTKREEYDEFGRIVKETYYDHVLNVPRHELYYDENYRCYLSKWFKVVDGKSIVHNINWFDENGNIIRVFRNDDELVEYWLDQLTSSKEIYFITVERRPLDKYLLSVNKPNVFRICMLHSNHTQDNESKTPAIRGTYKIILNNLDKFDSLIVLTNQQKVDIAKRFGYADKIHVIPHMYEISREPDFSNRDLSRAVMLSRFSEEKQIDHAIHAFRKVCDVMPDKKLEIYGTGAEAQNLQSIIKQLNLENNVFIKDYATNVDEIFSTSAVSILSSRIEGFPLVILESLANGCPVISYNIRYGPGELINHRENGFLVNDIDELAEHIIMLFSNHALLKKMSSKAYILAKKFDRRSFMLKWSNLFEHVLKSARP